MKSRRGASATASRGGGGGGGGGGEPSTPPAPVECRITPWGVQYYNETTSIWEPNRPDVAIHGTWLQDSPHETSSRLVVPSRALLSSFRAPSTPRPRRSSGTLASEYASPATVTAGGDGGRCMILGLPVELMRQILDDLVPSGCAFQFLPCKDQKRPVQIVQKLVPVDATPGSHRAHLALAATCSEMNRVAASILYGENTFVWNVSASAVHAHTASATFHRFESWSRILRQRPAPLGPLSARSAAHLQRVVLVIALPPGRGTDGHDDLRQLVWQASDMLSHARRTQRVIIDIHQASREARRDETLKVDRLDVAVDGRRTEVALRPCKREPLDRPSKAMHALEPLHALRHMKNLSLTGAWSEGLAAELLRTAVIGSSAEAT